MNIFTIDEGLKSILLEYSSDLEEIYITNLNIPLNASLNDSIRSHRLVGVDFSYCSLLVDTSN